MVASSRCHTSQGPDVSPDPNEAETSQEKAFLDQVGEEKARILGKRPNVLVCGYSGSGKTSLIRAICGDLVPPEAISDARPATTGFDEYANESIRIWDSRGLEPGQGEGDFVTAMRCFVRERQSDPNVDHHVHLMWYTIQGCGARVTDCDLSLIRDILRPRSVIVVLTKADITRPEQLEAMTEVLVKGGVDPDRIVAASCLEMDLQGCLDLVRLTHSMLPAAYQDAFLEAQRVDREARIEAVRARRGKAAAIIAAAATTASAVGAVPIPLADACVLVPLQAGMIASLAGLYDLHAEAIRHAVLPFIARTAGMYTTSSLLKLVPGLGSVVSAAVAGAITAAMGWYVQGQFEMMAIAKITGAPIPDLQLNLAAFTRYYREGRHRKPAAG